MMEEVGLEESMAERVVNRCAEEAKIVAVEQEKKKAEQAAAQAAKAAAGPTPREAEDMILRDLADPRVLPLTSVTRVRVSEDLSIADVYITVMGTPGQQTAALNALKHSAGMMRTRLTKDLSLRQAPFLKFHLDEDLKKELEMMELLDQVARENAELDKKRAEQAGNESPPTA